MKKKVLEHLWYVNILGTKYNLYVDEDFKELDALNADGYVSEILKEIHVRNTFKGNVCLEEARSEMERLLRHELIHAFVYECGLTESTSEDCSWAVSESMTDFWAIQFYKLDKIFKDSLIIVDEYEAKAKKERAKRKDRN